MAITGTYDYNGVPIANAIAEVNFIQFREPASPTTATFSVALYADAVQYAAKNSFLLNGYAIEYAEVGGGVWAQCYAHLLALPEYSGWVDFPSAAA